IRRRYQTYKDQYQVKVLNAFLNEHKGEEWFREKYHPIDSLPLREEIAKRKKTVYPSFLESLNAGKLDDITFDEIINSAAPQETNAADAMDATAEIDEATEPKKEDTGLPVPALQQMPVVSPFVSQFKLSALFLKAVPPNIKRQQLVEVCQKVEGFTYLAISDPRPDKKFYRIGWIVFEEGTNLEKAMEELNQKKIEDFSLNLAMHNTHTVRARLLPTEFNSPERLERDLENARRLVKALDQESGISNIGGGAVEAIENRLQDIVFKKEEFIEPPKDDERMDEDENLAGIEKITDGPTPVSTKKTKLTLDILIEYLRKVHWYDFYSGIEADGPEDFSRRAWIHLRKASMSTSTTESTDGPPPIRHKKSEFQHLSERLDSRVALRTLILSPGSWGGEELEKLGGKNPEAEVDKILETKHVAKIEAEKYRCKDCSKLFRGEEFVKKHIRSKHPEVVKELRVGIDFYNAYVRDPNRVHYAYGIPTPAQQGNGGF
ncbi:hypothetical protein HDU67_003532, partial [Dinochytrium kinnereticum]